MEERVEDVLRNYELELLRAYRVRGAYLLETRQGTYLYKGYHGTETRAGYEAAIQSCLEERGFPLIDRYVANCEGEFLSYDTMGEAHIVKRWFVGEECSLREQKDVRLASNRLAELHTAMKGLRTELPFEVKPRDSHLEDLQRRHLRELQRIKTYIRNKRDRNPFEVRYLQCAEELYHQGEEAAEFLARQKPGELEAQAEQNGDFVHGSYTYHNLILQKNGTAVVQYDKSWLGLQVLDLYYLLRKTLEKNEWSLEAGEWVMESYQEIRPLAREERQILYALLWFPDKFWKIANSYYNGKKSRIPGRNLVKLEEFLGQEEKREQFLSQGRYRIFS